MSEKKSRKTPCTKKVFDRWVKDLAKSCAWCVIEQSQYPSQLPKLNLADIVTDSVSSSLSFLAKEENVIWYAVNKLEIHPRAVEEVLADLVFVEAQRDLEKKESNKRAAS